MRGEGGIGPELSALLEAALASVGADASPEGRDKLAALLGRDPEDLLAGPGATAELLTAVSETLQGLGDTDPDRRATAWDALQQVQDRLEATGVSGDALDLLRSQTRLPLTRDPSKLLSEIADEIAADGDLDALAEKFAAEVEPIRAAMEHADRERLKGEVRSDVRLALGSFSLPSLSDAADG